jgi:hypothetical protein
LCPCSTVWASSGDVRLADAEQQNMLLFQPSERLLFSKKRAVSLLNGFQLLPPARSRLGSTPTPVVAPRVAGKMP